MSNEASGTKRKLEEPSTALVEKKQRTGISSAIVRTEERTEPERTSDLMAPIVLLTGHEAAVNSISFSTDGQHLVSGSADKQIFLWNVYGNCENTGVLRGHVNQVLEVKWGADAKTVVSASADKSGSIWDVERLKRIKRLGEHTAVVHSVSPSRINADSVVTVSDDGLCKLWDSRTKLSVASLPHQYPLTSVAFDDKGDGQGLVYCGGIDNLVHAWDLRQPDREMFRLMGHRDTLTSLRLDPFGSFLLSNAMDNELRIWDVRPFATGQRCLKVFQGVVHNFEKELLKSNWAPDGSLITSGSSDRCVYVWDTTSRQIRYKLPGHEGNVLESAFHPKQPIVGSCGSDRKIYLGEIAKYGSV